MKNGKLVFGNDFMVDSSFTTNELNIIKKKYSIEKNVINGKFESYKARIDNFNGRNIIATLFFEDGLITRVCIYTLSKNSHGWTTNSEAEQKNKKLEQDKWLQGLLNDPPPYIYSWGVIESSYDPKACVSQVIVSFKAAGSILR